MDSGLRIFRKLRFKNAFADANYVEHKIAATPTAPWVLNWPANPPGSQQALIIDTSGNITYQPLGGGGSVTSVGLSLPSIFSVSGSPVTASGTLTASLISQSVGSVFAGPSSGGVTAPTFRSLVDTDIPSLTATKISNFDTAVRVSRLDQLAAPTSAVVLNSQKITGLAEPTMAQDAATKSYVDGAITGVTRYKGVANGSSANPDAATGTSTFLNGDMYKVTTSGSAAFGYQVNVGDLVIYNGATWDKIDATDPAVTGTTSRVVVVPVGDTSYTIDISSAYVGQASITTLGNVTTGTWSASTIALDKGGTGATTTVGARSALGVPGKYEGTFTDAALVAGVLTINHSLNNLAPIFAVTDSSGFVYEADNVRATDANTITVDLTTFGTLTGTHNYTVVG